MWHTKIAKILKPLLTVATLTALLCIPSLSIAQTDVGGEIWGEWTAEGSPYYVENTIIIPEDRELYIGQGVDVIFTNYYSIEVYGTLIANGGRVGNDRILFMGDDNGNDGTTWNGIYFRREGDYVSSLTNCDIYDARTAISCEDNSPQIVGDNIIAVNVGINCVNAYPTIEENSIEITGDETSLEIIGISLRDHSNPRIAYNHKISVRAQENGSATGIMIRESDPIIRDNWITVSSVRGDIYGILAHRSDKLLIKRNIIEMESDGNIKGLWIIQTTDVNFLNNTVQLRGYSEIATGLVIGEDSRVSVVNNIVVGNGHSSIGINVNNRGEVHDSSDYNDFWAHATNYEGAWRGDNDISADPLFMDNEDAPYRLSWPNFPDMDDEGRSPCIDAGNPRLFDDVDDTRSDMGRFAYEQEFDVGENIALAPEAFRLLSAYPNPFNGTTTIGFEMNRAESVTLALFDLQGRLVERLHSGVMSSGSHRLLWNAADYPTGQYLLQLNSSTNRMSQNLILIK